MNTKLIEANRLEIRLMSTDAILDAQLEISRELETMPYELKNTKAGLFFSNVQSAIYRAMTTELRSRGAINY